MIFFACFTKIGALPTPGPKIILPSAVIAVASMIATHTLPKTHNLPAVRNGSNVGPHIQSCLH